jgi:hypothetical protein
MHLRDARVGIVLAYDSVSCLHPEVAAWGRGRRTDMVGYQVVMVWTTGAAVGYAAAKHKGYSPVAGAAAGAFLGPLFAWVLFLIDGILSSNELKPCPLCAEWIHPKATVCRFCNRDLPKPPSGPARLLQLVYSRKRPAIHENVLPGRFGD